MLRAADIGAALPPLLAAGRTRAVPEPGRDLVLETDMAELRESAVRGMESPGEPHRVSCPDCHGVMSRVRTGEAVHYRGHVGHAFGPASLLQAQQEASESALASLEERAAVHRELAELPTLRPHRQQHLDEAEAVAAQARLLRRQLRRSVAT